jgi:hypothetical protein
VLNLVLVGSLAAAAGAQTPRSGSDIRGSDPNQHLRLPPALAEAQSIVLVYVHLRNSTGDPAADEKVREEIAEAFGIQAGDAFSELVAEHSLVAVRALPAVEAAEYRVYSADGGGQVNLALLVTLRVEALPPAKAAAGAAATGRLADLPLIWQDERSLLKVVFNPSIGAYVDRDAWLGNPGAFVGLPDQDRTLQVAEAGLELGIGGITRVGGGDAYVYGATSYVWTTTQGRDVYTDDSSRVHGEIEDLYAGVLVARKESKNSFSLSAGRQKFTLNRNLLIGHVLGASNGGPRAASNLSPRNAYDMTVDARWRLGDFVVQAWLADPDELPASDSRSRYAGVNFKYNDNQRIDASLTVLEAIRSDTKYPTPDGTVLSRDGLRAVNPRVRWNSALGVENLWLEAEWAHQWHADYSMSADGGGVWAGYTFAKASWSPAVLYRYAVMTGDDPATATYERFDTLTGGVQRDWAQGLDMIKVAINRNMRTHRVEFSVKPAQGLELSVDYYYFTADELNNRGGQRPLPQYADDYLGQEITPTLQWMIGKSLYVQALATFLIPGNGLEDALPEPAHVWQTYQLSLYFFF